MTTNRRNLSSEDLKAQVIEKIAQFSKPNKPLAKRIHELIMEASPELHPRLWYGMPGYAKTKDSPVLCFFREDKYMTFGLTEAVAFAPKKGAKDMLMPCAWFFTELDSATEKKIKAIVKESSV